MRTRWYHRGFGIVFGACLIWLAAALAWEWFWGFWP